MSSIDHRSSSTSPLFSFILVHISSPGVPNPHAILHAPRPTNIFDSCLAHCSCPCPIHDFIIPNFRHFKLHLHLRNIMINSNNNFLIHRNNNQPQPLRNYPSRAPQQWPMQIPFYQLEQQDQHRFHRVHPEFLIQTVITSKIMQEQREAAAAAAATTKIQQTHLPQPSPSKNDASPFGFGMQRIRPADLIQSVTESKIAQKRIAAKMQAEKKRLERFKQSQRVLAEPPDFAAYNPDSLLELTDFMMSLPATYGKKFRYNELTKAVPQSHSGRYSSDQILIVGAQMEMAKLKAQWDAMARGRE